MGSFYGNGVSYSVFIFYIFMLFSVSARLVRDLSLEGNPPDGLVLESAFNNLHDVVLNHPFSLVWP